MKKMYLFAAVLSMTILFTSCSKDPNDELPGTWSTSDGGTITFVSDGTGTVFNSDFFNFDCGSITTNGVTETIGPVTAFDWQIVDSGAQNDNLFMEFNDSTSFSFPCAGSIEFPVKINSKNKATIGATVLGFGLEVELTR